MTSATLEGTGVSAASSPSDLPHGDVHDFTFVLVNPARYDEDGYVISWQQPPVPSNSLACVYALIEDFVAREIEGTGVRVHLEGYDETAGALDVPAVIEKLAGTDTAGRPRGMVGLVGVQTNQYPRALDLAKRLRAADVPVAIGGFHVSGILNLFGEPSPEIQEAIDVGASLFIGEAEGGRMDQFVRDALAGALQPVYREPGWSPELESAAVPHLPDNVARAFGFIAPMDAGRGCPFQCSFCTIINVHGRGARQRNVAAMIDRMREARAGLAYVLHHRRQFCATGELARAARGDGQVAA